MKKKILFVITKSNWGGAQRYVFDLATNLSKDEFDVAVACGGTGTLIEKLKEKNVRVLSVSSFQRDISAFKEFVAFGTLLKIFKIEKPDILHLNSSKAGVLGALAARIVGVKKVIFTIHGIPYDEQRNILWRTGAYIGTWFTIWLCHRVITVSKDNQKRVSTSALIRNGIAQTSLGDGAIIRSVFPSGAYIAGTIGELTHNKNHMALIEQAKENATMHVAIVGEGELYSMLEQKIKEYKLENRVRLFGFIHAHEVLRGFDIFVLPSIKEGLPYVLLEAGLAGIPVVAHDVGGIPDIIEDGVTGMLMHPKKPWEIKNALVKYSKDSQLRARHGEALKRKIGREFSLRTMVSETISVYES